MDKLLLLLLVVWIPAIIGQTCYDNKHVDGCTVPKITPYKQTFRPACVKHDMCYLCGKGRGFSQLRCDQLFLDRMKEICRGVNIFLRPKCLEAAATYYAGVRAFGDKHYEDPSHGDCKKAWARNCEL